MYDGRLRALEEKLKRYIDDRLATAVKIRPYSVSSADGTTDKVKGYDNDEQKYDADGQRMWPFGIRARPPAGVDAVWIALGGRNKSGHGVIVGAESKGYGPGDLADGEVALYNKVSGCVVRLNADGTISINGTTYSAPQWDAFAAALDAFLTSLAGITTPITLANVISAIGTIVTAAGTLKGLMMGNSDYKSTKVKWG